MKEFIANLDSGQVELRRRILDVSFQENLSHLGSCLSAVDIIDSIYDIKKSDEKFVLSAGHAGLAWYVVLEKRGYINAEHLKSFHVHPDMNRELGIEVSSGSLGQGLPISLGMALADRERNVYCLVSDGECAEGSIWEALRVASEYSLTNLKVIVNCNGFSAYGDVNTAALKRKMEGFDWKVINVDGHSKKALASALSQPNLEVPTAVLALTKVEQFPFLAGLDAHYHMMTEVEYNEALIIIR